MQRDIEQSSRLLKDNITGIELVIDTAQKRGENSDPGHEVEDLQDALREMWQLLSPGQKLLFMGSASLIDRITAEIETDGAVDPGDLLDMLNERLLLQLRASVSGSADLYSAILLQFPGFAFDTDVTGSDLVDWLAERFEALRAG